MNTCENKLNPNSSYFAINMKYVFLFSLLLIYSSDNTCCVNGIAFQKKSCAQLQMVVLVSVYTKEGEYMTQGVIAQHNN